LGRDPQTGKPISVRYGKYGPFVQLGTKDDAEKPKFASLRPHQRMDALTLDEAFELFKLPRTLGKTAQGATIKVAIGRFGPYVQYGEKKYVSIKDDDPYTVELPRALELIQAKEVLDANRIILDFPEAGIQVLNGRYGPYITDRIKNAKMPKDREPKSLTLQECKELLAAAPLRTKGRFGKFAAKKKTVEQPSAAATRAPGKRAGKTKVAPDNQAAPNKAEGAAGGKGTAAKPVEMRTKSNSTNGKASSKARKPAAKKRSSKRAPSANKTASNKSASTKTATTTAKVKSSKAKRATTAAG
jgi:DNA topoisomerase-1